MVSGKTLVGLAAVATLLCATLGVGIDALTSPATAQARAIDARLGGAFRIVGKITDSNDGTRGEVKARRYVFTPLCPRNACRKVALEREGPSNDVFRSFLRRKRRGVYKGTERSGRIGCPGPRSGAQRVRLRFRIVAARRGRATAIRGRARFEIDCPGRDLFQKARLYGTRR